MGNGKHPGCKGGILPVWNTNGDEIRHEAGRRLLSDSVSDHTKATRKGGDSDCLDVESDFQVTSPNRLQINGGFLPRLRIQCPGKELLSGMDFWRILRDLFIAHGRRILLPRRFHGHYEASQP